MNKFDTPNFQFGAFDNSFDMEIRSREETPTYDRELLMKNSVRSNNERLIPSGKELMDKKFFVAIWSYIQTHSKCNHSDGYRYISEKDLSIVKMSKCINNLSRQSENSSYSNKAFDRKTLKNKIDYLKEKKYILEKVTSSTLGSDYKGDYYRIRNDDVFQYYILLENEFLESLHTRLSQDGLKLYFLYYGFNKCSTEGECYLNQDEILKRIGLTKTGANLKKLRYLNHHLKQLGLIKTYKKICKDGMGRKIKEKNITIAPLYWKTSYYINLKGKKTTCDNLTYEYIEI